MTLHVKPLPALFAAEMLGAARFAPAREAALALHSGRTLVLEGARSRVTQPQFRYTHQWRAGDLLIWDTAARSIALGVADPTPATP